MRTSLLTVVAVLAIPAYGAASPCVPDLLSAYISLGSTGCEIGGATIADFLTGVSLGPGSPAKVDDDDILVTPTSLPSGTELTFSFIGPAGTSAPGENNGIQIVYSIFGLSFTNATKSMIGSVTESGAATAVEDLCLGDVFVIPQLPIFCLGVPEFLIADPFGGDFKTFGSSFFDISVILDIQFDVPFSGSAEVESVTNRFGTEAVVPEPVSLLLLGAGLAGTWARRHRRLTS